MHQSHRHRSARHQRSFLRVQNRGVFFCFGAYTYIKARVDDRNSNKYRGPFPQQFWDIRCLIELASRSASLSEPLCLGTSFEYGPAQSTPTLHGDRFLLGKVLGIPPEFWLQLQTHYELFEEKERLRGELERLRRLTA